MYGCKAYALSDARLRGTDKKKKSVSWAPDGQLESVKLIERAVYDDDPADVSALFRVSYVLYINLRHTRFALIGTQGMHAAHSVRDLDRSEGAALIAHLFDEQIDWSEPFRKQTSRILSENRP